MGGWLPGVGRLDGLLGSLLVGYHDDDGLRYAGRVGSGITAASRARLVALLTPLGRDTCPFTPTPKLGRTPGKAPVWVEPEIVVEVAFHEWTSSDVLRAPRYKGIRDDKAASEVVREIG